MTSATSTRVTRSATLTLGEDGILRVTCLPLAEQTLADALENTRAGEVMAGGRRVPMFVDNRQLKSYTKEARSYYTSPESTRNHLAVALLIGSPVHRVIGNFFIAATAGTTPTKLFTSEPEAIAWLKGFLP